MHPLLKLSHAFNYYSTARFVSINSNKLLLLEAVLVQELS
jgi:hypothetical protein